VQITELKESLPQGHQIALTSGKLSAIAALIQGRKERQGGEDKQTRRDGKIGHSPSSYRRELPWHRATTIGYIPTRLGRQATRRRYGHVIQWLYTATNQV